MARILVIDDDRNLLDMVAMAFEDQGHDVVTAPDGLAGFTKVSTDKPDLVVSDVNMPGLDGFSLCRRVRESGNTVPLVLLTARDTEIDEALGLELGADDYVIKPFATRVLQARVAALLRREQLRRGVEQDRRPLRVGSLELEPERLETTWRGEPITTTVTEFRLIHTLASRPGVIYSRDQLLDRIRGDDSVVAVRLIDTYVRRLRRKLESVDPSFDQIETVIGAGYRWRDRR